MSGTIDSIINSASTGLAAAQAAIGVVSNNVANASVATYNDESLTLTSFQVGAQTDGVKIGQVTRSVNQAVQSSLSAANANVSALTVTSQALTAINDTQGTPGDGTSLSDQLTALQDGFTTLLSNPSSTTQQTALVSAASGLANTINTTAAAITAQQNSAQSQIVSTVTSVNAALATVRQTTQEIMGATASGTTTAALSDQRDAALSTLTNALGITYSEQANGNVTLLGQNGLSIPLDSTLSTSAATLSPGSTSAPPIVLQSSNPNTPAQNVTGLISGGSLGALLTLRDTTLPTYTAELDQFSEQLATRLSQQGLNLFTNGSGNIPSDSSPSSYAGFSSTIQVNPAILSNPSLVRDGTPNANTSGAAGFSGVISQVVNYGFGSTSDSAGTSYTPIASAGLGPSGTLTSTLSGITDLSSYAQAFVAAQSSDTSQASTDLTNATSYQTTTASAYSAISGVNVDQQMGVMIQLQNSYQANATIIQTAEQMFSSLLSAVQTG